jgi:hypothetical protein
VTFDGITEFTKLTEWGREIFLTGKHETQEGSRKKFCKFGNSVIPSRFPWL